MHYEFQPSKIWDGSQPGDVDINQPLTRVKARSIVRARKQLGDPGLGRNWILVRATQTKDLKLEVFKFQESAKYDGERFKSDNNGKVVYVKASNIAEALGKTPQPTLGCVWHYAGRG